MNVFRILGDLSHLLAMFLLLVKIWRSKSCAGERRPGGAGRDLGGDSGSKGTTRASKNFSQVVRRQRIREIMRERGFRLHGHGYRTSVVFLLCAYVTVYMIYWKFRKTFDIENDTFRLEFLLVPVIGLSFLVNYSYTPTEVLWTFSIYLESVAILPQLFMISKTGEAETITTHYLFFLGLYRALYLANWIWRYQTENFYDQISVVSGVVQTIFYCDFFYLYVTKVLKGKKLSLPMPV
ncbi:KDEL (Lys-Asp-Glu-Leu) endoplasmic reticulum protein retention receptor 3 [Cricetulus griseus]